MAKAAELWEWYRLAHLTLEELSIEPVGTDDLTTQWWWSDAASEGCSQTSAEAVKLMVAGCVVEVLESWCL